MPDQPSPEQLTLADLEIGRKAVVAKVEGNDVVAQRLLEMGLLEGETVELLGIAPWGDPLEVRVGTYRLSLRKSEASRVVVAVNRD